MSTDRIVKTLRISPELSERLARAARHSGGKTEQAIMVDGLKMALEEEEARTATGEGGGGRSKRREPREARRPEKPRGLGLGPRPEAPPPEPERSASTAPAQGVVVNVGTAAAAGGADIIKGLAAWIVAGPDFERRSRTVQAVEILKAGSGTTEEKEAQAVRLEEAIKTLEAPGARKSGLLDLLGGGFDFKEWLKP